jgi:hypothetical protein
MRFPGDAADCGEYRQAAGPPPKAMTEERGVVIAAFSQIGGTGKELRAGLARGPGHLKAPQPKTGATLG